MRYLVNSLFLILFFPAFSGAATSGDCSWLLTKNLNGTSASEALNKMIRDQLEDLGVPLTVKTQSTVFTRWRAKRLLNQVSPSNLRDEHFRNRWVDQIIALMMDENIDILSQLNHPMTNSQHTALLRLVLRSLVHRGLGAYIEQVNFKTDWRAIIGKIRSHPVFRMIFFWELPHRHLTLSDEQLLNVIHNGSESVPDLSPNLITSEQREVRKRAINKWTATAVVVFLAASTGWAAYPEVNDAFEKGHQTAVQENTQVFINQVDQLSLLDSQTLTLDMARSELRMLTDQFVERFGETPTSTEAQELRTQVCTVRYGDILSAESQAQCMAQ